MGGLTDKQRWVFRGVFLLIAMITILLPLLPLGLTADAMTMPDLFFALIFAWVVRSPETAPFVLVFVMALIADALLNRPIGLWTFLTLGIVEYLRGEVRTMREHMLAVETIIFGFAMGFASLVNVLILNLALVDTPALSLVFAHVLTTIAAYPFVVAILHFVVGVRAPRLPTTSDRLGTIR